MKLNHPDLSAQIDVPETTARVLRKRGWHGPGEGAAPAKSATKDEWIDHAVALGADPDEAESATKDDLIADFGS